MFDDNYLHLKICTNLNLNGKNLDCDKYFCFQISIHFFTVL